MIRQRNIAPDSLAGVHAINTGRLTSASADVWASQFFSKTRKVEIVEVGILGAISTGSISIDVYSYLDGTNPFQSGTDTLEFDGSALGATLDANGPHVVDLREDPIVVDGDDDANGDPRVGLKLETTVSSPTGQEWQAYALVRPYRDRVDV